MEERDCPARDGAMDAIRGLIDEVAQTPLVEIRDIPKVELYMEQVISFFDQELRAFARDPDDKVFTNTMINNYAKAGILPRPNKKRYGRNHLITLIYIFLLKQVLSIQDIGDFFALMEDDDPDKLEAFYNLYQEMADEGRAEYARVNEERARRIAQRLKEHGLDDARYEKMMLLSLLSLEATAHKMVATRLLDASKEQSE